MSGDFSINPVFHGSLALVAGNLLGSVVDTVIMMLNERANLTGSLDLNDSTRKVLDNGISILLHVGFLGFGTSFVTKAFPWITEDSASFTLWIMGISMNSDTLRQNVKVINECLTLNPNSVSK